MKKLIVKSKDESKLLHYLRDNRDKFLQHFALTVSKNEDVMLVFGNEFLRELVIEEKIEESLNENKVFEELFIVPEYESMKNLYRHLDFSNLKYSHLHIDGHVLNFMKEYNIPVKLDNLVTKDLSYLSFEGQTISGSFDGAIFYKTKIINCIDEKGERIKINPKKVRNNDFTGCEFENVEFTGSFDDCKIKHIRIKNCINVQINPSRARDKCLRESYFDGVEFIGPFDGCDVYEMHIGNSKGAKINPQKVKNSDLSGCHLEGVEFLDSIDICSCCFARFENMINLSILGRYLSDEYLKMIRYSSCTIYVRNIDDWHRVLHGFLSWRRYEQYLKILLLLVKSVILKMYRNILMLVRLHFYVLRWTML